MKITAKEGRYNKIHISIDDEYLTTVDADFWFTSGYVSGDEISEGELAVFKSTAGSRRAFNAAADIISRREHSEKELRIKLLRRFDEECAENAIARLKELGLVDDARFARMYAEELYLKKGFGERRIKYELSAKGVSSDIAEEVISAFLEENEEDNVSRIVDIIEKKYYNIKNDEKQYRRAVSALQRLGYSYGDIHRALNRISEDDYDTSEGW